MANINTQNVSKAEEALFLASKDLIAFGKLLKVSTKQENNFVKY